MKTDQWELEGNCAECRRANYCSKDCKARKNRKFNIVKQAFSEFMEEKNPGILEMMDKMGIYKNEK